MSDPKDPVIPDEPPMSIDPRLGGAATGNPDGEPAVIPSNDPFQEGSEEDDGAANP